MRIDNEQLKQSLRRLFERKYGRKNTITRHELKMIFPRVSDRKIRMTIHELRREDVPILPAMKPPYGYYMPSNLKEAREGLESIESYIKDMLITRRAVKRNCARYIEGDKQLSLV